MVGRDALAQTEVDGEGGLGEETPADVASDGAERAPEGAAAVPPLLDGPAFARATEEHVRRLGTDAERFSLVALDIDHFRQVNDVHGHPTGDLVIGRVAQVLRESIRENDVVARVGGEEFMVLLPGLTLPEAAEVAERLRSAVELAKMPEQVRRITISLGVVSPLPGSLVTGSEAMALAERALEQAKGGGRNRVRSME
jgi:diguanylate cyclase (GGDEF)-like protein